MAVGEASVPSRHSDHGVMVIWRRGEPAPTLQRPGVVYECPHCEVRGTDPKCWCCDKREMVVFSRALIVK